MSYMTKDDFIAESDALIDGLADGDIRPADFVRRYMALGYTRAEALAVVEDNRKLGNIE